MIYHAFKHYVQYNWKKFHRLGRYWDAFLTCAIAYTVSQPVHAIIDLAFFSPPINEYWLALPFFILAVTWPTVRTFLWALWYGLRFTRGYAVIDMAFGYRARCISLEDQDYLGMYFEKYPPREEKIIAAANLTRDGTLWCVFDQGRHHHCIWFMAQYGRNHEEHSQGFLTNKYRYINRQTARQLAMSNGQCVKPGHSRDLFSEDLWETPEHLRYQG